MRSMFLVKLIGVLTVYLSLTLVFPDSLLAQDLKVTDIRVASGKQYKVGDKGIDVGTTYYIDRAYVVNKIPKELAGSTFIMTANDDKNSTGADFLRFTVNMNVEVWLAHDSRGEKEKGGTPPEWLSEKNGWVKHPDMIMEVTDTNMGFFIFWSKDFKKGEVTIGGNADPPAAGQGSNYVVLIKPGKSLKVESMGKVLTMWAKIKQ